MKINNKTSYIVNSLINIIPLDFLPNCKPIHRLILALCSSWFEQANFNYCEKLYKCIGNYYVNKINNIKLEINTNNIKTEYNNIHD